MHQGNDDYDYKIKCAIVGQRSVGKTSLLKRFSEEKFNEIYEATLGVEFASKTLTYNSKKVKLHIYDTAGQESFQSITKSYYKGAHAIFFVYDITDETTFDKILHYWFDQVKKHVDAETVLLLIGNKSDLKAEEKVCTEKGRAFANEKKMMFYETSAKTAYKVNGCFTDLISKIVPILQSRNIKPKENPQNNIILKPAQTQNKKSKDGCC